MYKSKDAVTVKGIKGACIFECTGPESDKCSVLEDVGGCNKRHYVKLADVKAAQAAQDAKEKKKDG